MITAMKDTPFIAKHQAGPIAAYVNPAIAGPATVPRLKIDEFSAIAFVICSLLTNSRTKDCRAGASKAVAIPNKKARTKMCQGLTVLVNTRADSIKAKTIIAVWVITNKVLLEIRSAITPPYRVKNQVGIPEAMAIYPRYADDPVKT